MRMTERTCAVRVAVSICLLLASVVFLITIYGLHIVSRPGLIDVSNLKQVLPLSYSKEEQCAWADVADDAADRLNATYSHSRGSYVNGYETSYVPGTEDTFLMIKTGATVLWQRLPIHIATTLPQVVHYAIYSDSPDRIAGIPVVDILAETSETLRKSDEFRMYRKQAALLHDNANIEFYDPRSQITGAWDLDKFKNLPMAAHAYRTNPAAKWYIFMDADSYILWPNMMRWLRTLRHTDVLYMGSVAYYGTEAFAHGGSGVIMSAGLMKRTFGSNPNLQFEYEEYSKFRCCGDHILAHAFLDQDIHVLSGDSYPRVAGRIQGEPPHFVRLNKENWCREVATFHHLTAHDVAKLYEFEKKFHPSTPILYKDVYHEFVMPYISHDKRENWDNMADSREYSRKNEADPENPKETAYNSIEDCAIKCDEWSECLQYKYKKGLCVVSSNVRLGVKDTTEGNKFTSFWRIGRIREMRKAKKCDNLGPTSEEGSYFM